MEKGVSITICTYNGKDRIASAINSIAKQKNVDDIKIELLIVDNASTDNTLEFCKVYLQVLEFPFDYSLLTELKVGAINARNTALKNAKYEWLLICDDDNELCETYISKAFQILNSNSKIGALGGKGLAVCEMQKPNWFDKYCSSYAVEKQNTTNGKIEKANAALYGAGSFFKANVLKNIYENNFKNIMQGPNQKQLTRGEDTEWCYLLLLENFEIWYDDALTFKHHLTINRLNWNYYLSLKKGIASGAALLFGYHFMLKQKKQNVVSFFAKYFNETLYQFALTIKCGIEYCFNKSKEKQLGLIIAKAKLKSYLNNYSIAFSSYKYLKQNFTKAL